MSRIITKSYAVYGPDHDGDASERGWVDETGVEFENVLEAADWLRDEGAVHPSSSEPAARIWFDGEDDVNFASGRVTVASYHPSGFTDRELATLHAVVVKSVPLGHPDMLGYCFIDDLQAFQKDFVTDADGVIVESTDESYLGTPLAAAYVERFAGFGEDSPWEPTDDGSVYVHLGLNDSVLFNVLDRPVLVRRQGEDGPVYGFEPGTRAGPATDISAPRR